MQDMEGKRIGVLIVIYDYYKPGVIKNLTEIQHKFHMHINSVLHFHITENNFLEVITVKGDVKDIRKLTEEIMKLKGVEHVKLNTESINK